jgi:hypothetical protein
MGLTSTPFISYHEITTDKTDLLTDAFGLNTEFCDVIEFLGRINTDPGDHLTSRLFELISKKD